MPYNIPMLIAMAIPSFSVRFICRPHSKFQGSKESAISAKADTAGQS
jgi:hypothetical protein